jgi:hypothetical protein
MDKKSKGITNNTLVVPMRKALQKGSRVLEDVGDEEVDFQTSPNIGNYYTNTKTTIKYMEIEQQVLSSPPPWFFVLQKLIADLAIRVVDLQKIKDDELAQTLKIYNATIYDLNNNEYDLAVPIQVVIEEYSDETVARIPELNIFTSSDTDTEAILLLKQEVVNLYKELGQCKNLGELPKSWLNTLNKLLKKQN